MSAIEIDAEHAAGEFRLHARFAVPADGITVLFGPSGSGKSLTLALLAGLRRPDRGRIVLAGRTVDDADAGIHVAPQQRRIGMVFQDALLLPHRTALDNVALAVRGGGSRRERREEARRALADVGAAELAGARPATLSGGERQRVALARALAGGPEVLLLDEPFSALDRPVRRELRALVRRLTADRGVPALLVTHDHEELADLADRVVVFAPGRVRGVLAPDEVGDDLAGIG